MTPVEFIDRLVQHYINEGRHVRRPLSSRLDVDGVIVELGHYHGYPIEARLEIGDKPTLKRSFFEQNDGHFEWERVYTFTTDAINEILGRRAARKDNGKRLLEARKRLAHLLSPTTKLTVVNGKPSIIFSYDSIEEAEADLLRMAEAG